MKFTDKSSYDQSLNTLCLNTSKEFGFDSTVSKFLKCILLSSYCQGPCLASVLPILY